MSVYLHDLPLEEAQERLWQALQSVKLHGLLGKESIPLNSDARGRVLADSLLAKISSPQQHKSAMDGFALRSEDTHGASQIQPVELSIPDQAQYLDTGDLIPKNLDAVIPIENVEAISKDGSISESHSAKLEKIRIRSAVTPWNHIRPLGEDFVATQLVLHSGHILRPIDLGAIAASGHAEVIVARKPKVAVLPTGSELIEIGKPIVPEIIIESNSLILSGQLAEWGAEVSRFPIISDDFDLLLMEVREASKEHDLILINAGSSAGSEDYTAKVVQELGELLVHGVAVRPGHPVVLGMIHGEDGAQTPVIGVPGYPVSAALTNEIFVEPLISLWLGKTPASPKLIDAELTQKITSPPGDDDFVRVAVGNVGEKLLAAPLKRGAGVLSSLIHADGLALLPSGIQGQAAGAKVSVRLYSKMSEVEKNIFVIGSHDLTIDILAQFLARHDRKIRAANVGSIGGLIALQRGVAHLAGAHLFDPKTKTYNLPFIKEYLPDSPVKIIGLVERQQGLIVKKGNPKGIKILEDLIRADVTFINRQRGSGTKILIDYHLSKVKIESAQIKGYEQEEYTHLSVAAAVAAGRADCGMGIHAAATALELDFVPLFKERYDLIIPMEFVDSELLKPLWLVLEEQEFRDAIDALPGYSALPLGKVFSN